MEVGVGESSSPGPEPDGRASWTRLFIALAMSAVGGAGMWCVVVVLPAVQAEFGVDRGAASLPYSLMMAGVAVGGILFGRMSDRHGIVPVAILGGTMLGIGFLAAALSPNLWTFGLIHGALIGVGCSASFAPVLADISFWFWRRRGIAIAVVASGNYVAGAIWPPIVQWIIDTRGWRVALATVGVVCLATIIPLALALGRNARRPAIPLAAAGPDASAGPQGRQTTQAALGLQPGTVQALLVVAGIACCVAMAMPQVHIVAYCGDLGYGPARGAQMLALMLGFGIVSRVVSGLIADRIGGLGTLMISSSLQGVALLLYLFFDGLASLYVISLLFGLFQGGIVPMYALVVRQFFPPEEAGARVGLCISSTLVGMALGGWMSGAIFDWTGSYRAAFLNGVAWNLVNVAIAAYLLMRLNRWRTPMREAGSPA